MFILLAACLKCKLPEEFLRTLCNSSMRVSTAEWERVLGANSSSGGVPGLFSAQLTLRMDWFL